MVVVDRLSKAAHFMPFYHPFTTRDVAEMFVREVMRLHGFPSSIIFDRNSFYEPILEA